MDIARITFATSSLAGRAPELKTVDVSAVDARLATNP